MENKPFKIRIVTPFKLELRVEYHIVLFTAFLLWKTIFSPPSIHLLFFFFKTMNKHWKDTRS